MSARPLLVTDCDEVLLHMVSHFGAWLDEAHALSFEPIGGSFASSTRRRDGSLVPDDELWPLLNGFFDTEMHRQTLVPGAVDALGAIGEVADIVILTNLLDQWHEGRVAQLAAHGIRHRVMCNQGGKGTPLRALLTEYRPPVAAFVDDLAVHHGSVAQYTPEVWRLHMIADPGLAAGIPRAPDAHARIDEWGEATEWLLERLRAGEPA